MVALARFAFGESPVSSDKLNAFIDAWNGNTGGVNQGNSPLSVTAINDPIAYAGSFKNSDGSSKALIAYNAVGTVLLQADSGGVKVSPDGTTAPTTAVVVGGVQTISGQKTFTGGITVSSGITVSGGLTASGAIDISGSTSVKGVPPQLNLLVNPGFEIWQRGTTSTLAGAYTADRWVNYIEGTTVTSKTWARDGTNVDTGSKFSGSVTVTTGADAGSRAGFQQKLEDFNQLKGRTISFSCRAKCSTAGVVQIRVYNTVAGSNTIASSTFHTGGGTWQTLTVTQTINTAATAVYVETGILGANLTGVVAQFDNAMLVISPVPVDYYPLTPADDLARCLRYYYRWTNDGANSAVAVGSVDSSTLASVMLVYPTLLGGTPTLSFSAAIDWYVSDTAGGGPNLTSMSIGGVGLQDRAMISCNVAGGLTLGAVTFLQNNVTAAWIAVEWNP